MMIRRHVITPSHAITPHHHLTIARDDDGVESRAPPSLRHLPSLRDLPSLRYLLISLSRARLHLRPANPDASSSYALNRPPTGGRGLKASMMPSSARPPPPSASSSSSSCLTSATAAAEVARLHSGCIDDIDTCKRGLERLMRAMLMIERDLQIIPHGRRRRRSVAHLDLTRHRPRGGIRP